MLIYIFLWNVVFNSFIFCGSNTLTSEHNLTKFVIPAKETAKKKLTLITEGGTIITETPIIKPKTNHTVLLSLDSEFGIKKQKPIQPRKGAPQYNVSEEVSEPPKLLTKVLQLHNLTANVTESTPTKKQHVNNSTTNVDNKVKNITEIIKINETAKIGDIKSTMTEHIKKPTILSYDVLAAMDVGTNNKQTKTPDIKSSANPIADQMPSPNEASGSKIKSQLVSASKNPGMIMPLVITILVVPAFAVLGYMALKRGKEAWKNRHYKRMDFLLDGMYND